MIQDGVKRVMLSSHHWKPGLHYVSAAGNAGGGFADLIHVPNHPPPLQDPRSVAGAIIGSVGEIFVLIAKIGFYFCGLARIPDSPYHVIVSPEFPQLSSIGSIAEGNLSLTFPGSTLLRKC